MKTTPMQHQLWCLENLKDREYYALFLEQGLGKTKVIIDDVAQNSVGRVLVIAPSGVHANWAHEELPKHADYGYEALVWDSSKNSQKYDRAIHRLFQDDVTVKFLCVNIEALRTERCMKICRQFLDNPAFRTMVVVDESTTIKNPKAQQTKAVLSLSQKADFRRILNGTPVTQGPLDLWSQCRFLHPNALPFNSWTSFKNTFAISQTIKMGQRSFEKIVGYQNLALLSNCIKGFSTRLTKEECLDLPDKIYQKLPVEMTAEQNRVYQRIRDQSVAELEEAGRNGLVTAPSVLAALMKLQQVTAGFVIDDEGIEHPLPNRRTDALITAIGSDDRKCVIWTNFRFTVKQIRDALIENFPHAGVLEYHGGISQESRTSAIHKFQNDPHYKFMILSYAGATGITLHAASKVIYYSNNYSLYKRLQSEDRTHRIGQKNNCLYIDLFTPGTTDALIQKALEQKKNLADTLITADRGWRNMII